MTVPCVVDSHVHVWSPHKLRYPWLDEIPSLNREFALADFDQQRDGFVVDRIVLVECDVAPGQGFAEAEWMSSLAQQDARIAAIVAHAPVETGESCLPYLERLAGLPLVRGVRRLIQGERESGFASSAPFVEGVRLLERFQWTFDIGIRWWQMRDAIDLIDRAPYVQFVLCHLGKPPVASGDWARWDVVIRELALRPNVVCKLSGLVTEADPVNWSTADIAPYVDSALDAFGASRLMFGSDWPVVTIGAQYRVWAAALAELTASLSPAELALIRGQVAQHIYRLPDS